jgi:hypothetical protein
MNTLLVIGHQYRNDLPSPSDAERCCTSNRGTKKKRGVSAPARRCRETQNAGSRQNERTDQSAQQQKGKIHSPPAVDLPAARRVGRPSVPHRRCLPLPPRRGGAATTKGMSMDDPPNGRTRPAWASCPAAIVRPNQSDSFSQQPSDVKRDAPSNADAQGEASQTFDSWRDQTTGWRNLFLLVGQDATAQPHKDGSVTQRAMPFVVSNFKNSREAKQESCLSCAFLGLFTRREGTKPSPWWLLS